MRYPDELREAAIRAGCAVHAYVLMANHVHLLATPADTGHVGHMMQALGRSYVRYINDRYRRTGTLWEGRYKACQVENDDRLLRCYRTDCFSEDRGPASAARGTCQDRTPDQSRGEMSVEVHPDPCFGGLVPLPFDQGD